MAIYNGEKLDVGYNRTPTKFYKNYSDRIKKVEEFRILQDVYKREMCDLKQENHRLKHELDSFISSISQGRYYRTDSFYPSKTISTNIRISDVVYTQMMGNENMLRRIIGYHVEQAVRDLMNGKCDR
jgi:di/tripeptidase